ncbi:Rho GTPase activation protein [Ephemerocybe angulata]|uniref:Rho GTPase activation protein n=1 Tax=Ephemerocybe angulata TaxID=980116 RepID=A0A8H6I8R0_9AGAR|nr:Rho GTPase activation protein [Tulosesus angulatus]
MLSSSHGSGSVSTSGHPPYPYAHLYPQPHASTSQGHRHQPHSHHGHGSQGISYLSSQQPQLGASSSPPRGPNQNQNSYGQYQGQYTQESEGSGSGVRLVAGSRTAAQRPDGGQGSQATKANLKAWWNQFNFVRGMKKDSAREDEDNAASGAGVVFGKPLKESLKYASVQISTANADGELYVWGYIPVVVAKCGLYLKENATEVPGTFRVNGSNRRMRELQAAFETPPRYGKNLDWKQETYTTHDVASVFRRYLTQMPEPVIPYDLYHQFRDALGREPFNQEEVIARYKALIRQMPRSNQYLLLYVLDLLSVFARKSDKNLMTATNLAVIFRPGLMSHPQHEMSPHEHALSQRVLEFLIAHQDWFMLEIPPPPGRRQSTHEATVDDVMTVRGGEQEVYSDIGGGGWKLVSRDKERMKMLRRRTTMERSGGALDEEDMSEGIATRDVDRPVSGAASGATVQRSRTLPSRQSRRKENASASGSETNVNNDGDDGAPAGKENVNVNVNAGGVQFAEGTGRGGREVLKEGSGGRGEKRSVLMKKNRRASSSVPGEIQRTS